MGVEEITITPLEKVTDTTAIPTDECGYPNCERCTHYVGYRGARYCTVPMVVNKQTWIIVRTIICDLRREISEIREMVTDVILGEDSAAETGNYPVEGHPKE